MLKIHEFPLSAMAELPFYFRYLPPERAPPGCRVGHRLVPQSPFPKCQPDKWGDILLKYLSRNSHSELNKWSRPVREHEAILKRVRLMCGPSASLPSAPQTDLLETVPEVIPVLTPFTMHLKVT